MQPACARTVKLRLDWFCLLQLRVYLPQNPICHCLVCGAQTNLWWLLYDCLDHVSKAPCDVLTSSEPHPPAMACIVDCSWLTLRCCFGIALRGPSTQPMWSFCRQRVLRSSPAVTSTLGS